MVIEESIERDRFLYLNVVELWIVEVWIVDSTISDTGLDYAEAACMAWG
jgi:hypothetical protein